MNLIKNSKGFSIVEVLIVVAVVGIVGLLGYNVYTKQNADKSNTKPSTSQTAKESGNSSDDVAEAPEIKTSKDLDTAEQTLDSMDVDSSSDDKALEEDLAF